MMFPVCGGKWRLRKEPSHTIRRALGIRIIFGVLSSHEHDLNYTYTLTRWNATVVTLPPEATVIPN